MREGTSISENDWVKEKGAGKERERAKSEGGRTEPSVHGFSSEEVGHCMLPYIRDQILHLA